MLRMFFSAAIKEEITQFDQIDIIFDTYKKNSLKAATQKSVTSELEKKLKIICNNQRTGMLFFKQTKSCTGTCTFIKAYLPCIELCRSNGDSELN